MIIKFDHDAYCATVARAVFYAVQDTNMELEARIGSVVSTIKMNKLDRTQKRTPSGIMSGMSSSVKVYDRTMRQGGRIVGRVMTGNTRDSVVALFYEYGTGEYSEMPTGRFKHLEPNPMYREGMIVGRPTQNPAARGRKAKGETYRVIAYRSGELTHATRGRRAGRRLKSLEVPAYHFMREGLAATVPTLKSKIVSAIEGVPVKQFFTFRSVRKR